MKTRSSIPFAGTTALLAGALAVGTLSARRVSEPLVIPLEQIESDTLGWHGIKDDALSPGVLRELSPTDYVSRTYSKRDQQLNVFVAYYAQQRAGESMHSPKHCLPGGGWEIWKHDSAEIPFNGTRALINKYSISNSGARMLMYYWYQSRDRIVANEFVGKFLLARDTLLTGHTAAAIVRLTLADVPGADNEALAMAKRMSEEVQRCMTGRPARF